MSVYELERARDAIRGSERKLVAEMEHAVKGCKRCTYRELRGRDGRWHAIPCQCRKAYCDLILQERDRIWQSFGGTPAVWSVEQ